VATERDHVSPWHSVYKIQRLVRAPVDFVLASGGHNVGIVSPPAGPLAHPEASHRWARHAAGRAPADAQLWEQQAREFEGSWWPRWHQWLHAHSTGRVKARPVEGISGPEGQPLAAPGTYVFQQ
jgi:polyhydroxyalkanoate synthase